MAEQRSSEETPGVRPPGRAARFAVAAVVVLVTAAMVGKYLHHDWKDVPVWYDVGQRVLTGKTLVGLTSYRYPPTFAVLIAPLCALPFGVFFFLWYAVNLALFWVAVRQTARLAGPAEVCRAGVLTPAVTRATPPPVPWLAVIVCSVYAMDNLFLGQTNILVTVLVYASFLYLLRGREWAAGIPLGLSIAVKVFTAPMIAYLLYRRRWNAAASTALSCAFFLLLFPAPFRGLDRNLHEVGDWGKRVVEPYLSKGKAGDWGQHALDFGNQSIQAVAHRYLTHVDANVAARQGKPMYVHLANLSESQVNRVVLAILALLAAVFIAACGWQLPRTREQEITEYALVTIGLLLISAIAWTYFFVMMLLPVAVAVGRGLRPSDPEGTVGLPGQGVPKGTPPAGALPRHANLALWAGVWAFVLATVLLSVFFLRALGSVCFAIILLYLALAGAVWRMRREAGVGTPALRSLSRKSATICGGGR